METITIDPSSDPLSADVSSVDTSFPRALAGLYELTIVEAKTEPNKAQTGENFVLKLKSTGPVKCTDEQTLPPGAFTITHRVGMAVTEKYSHEGIKKNLAAIGQAAHLSGITLRQMVTAPSPLIGRTVIAKVGIRPETAEFSESNEIKQFVTQS